MGAAIWIISALAGIGLIVWLAIQIREWLRWKAIYKDIAEVRVESAKIDMIVLNSRCPVEALAEVVRSCKDGLRKTIAAGHLAKMGTQEAAVVLCLVLEDEDKYVRREARNAVRSNSKATREFNMTIFGSVALGLSEADQSWADIEGNCDGDSCEDVIELLPRLDPARAAIELTKPNTLRINHPDLRKVIHELNCMRVLLPDYVFEWLAVLRPCVAERRRGVTGRSALVYSELLCAAALRRHPRVEEWIDDLFVNRTQVVEWTALEGAAKAKAVLAGLSMDLPDALMRRVEESGYEELSIAEKHFASVIEYEIYDPGGMGDFILFSSACDHAKEGLKAIGDSFVLPKLERALELRNQHHGSLDENSAYALKEKIDAIPLPSDKQYESIRMLAYLYAAAHADDFSGKL